VERLPGCRVLHNVLIVSFCYSSFCTAPWPRGQPARTQPRNVGRAGMRRWHCSRLCTPYSPVWDSEDCAGAHVWQGNCSHKVTRVLTLLPAVMLSPTNNKRRTEAGSLHGNGSNDPSVVNVSMVWWPSAKTRRSLRWKTVKELLT
jgi:hypothetical protein